MRIRGTVLTSAYGSGHRVGDGNPVSPLRLPLRDLRPDDRIRESPQRAFASDLYGADYSCRRIREESATMEAEHREISGLFAGYQGQSVTAFKRKWTVIEGHRRCV